MIERERETRMQLITQNFNYSYQSWDKAIRVFLQKKK